jgi:hypothetical protein
MYLSIKLVFSIIAEFIVAPWQIFKRIRETRAIDTLKKGVNAGNA